MIGNLVCLSGLNLNNSLLSLGRTIFYHSQDKEAGHWLRYSSCLLYLGSGLLSSIDLTV